MMKNRIREGGEEKQKLINKEEREAREKTVSLPYFSCLPVDCLCVPSRITKESS